MGDVYFGEENNEGGNISHTFAHSKGGAYSATGKGIS